MASVQEVTAALCSLPSKISWSEGISMLHGIDESGYRGNERTITENDIRQYLSEHPELSREWSIYSESKRTNSGWYFDYDLRRVGFFFVDGREQIRTFDDVASACAFFIKNEVDSMLGTGFGGGSRP